MYIYIYTYIHIYISVCMCIYIYIHRERERQILVAFPLLIYVMILRILQNSVDTLAIMCYVITSFGVVYLPFQVMGGL